jgi:RNAse (barnase) inhibitor barstar
MTGGLIQLITIGKQDTPLINNPEITFFKNVYRQHTQFSISNNERYLDTKAFDTVSSKNIEKNGDLLLNMAFKLEIPYFEIVKNIKTTQIIKDEYNLNSLDVNYLNTNCIVFYEKIQNKWIIIPENLFKLSFFEGIYYDINVNDLQKNLLPEYIKLIDLGENVKLYQIQDNPISPIISLLRVNSNYWEQLLLNYMSETKDTDLLNKLYTVNSVYDTIFKKLKYNLYDLYTKNNLYMKNNDSYNFNFLLNDGTYKTEIERYFEYLNSLDLTIKNLDTFDIDKCYNYCNINFLSFDNYKNNVLQYNSKIILFILNMMYSTPDITFTFWKKYNTVNNNEINKNIVISKHNTDNEWTENVKTVLTKMISLNSLNNQILETFIKTYSITQQEIINLFDNLDLTDAQGIYILLKTILRRFNNINSQLNFNNFYSATKYETNIESLYNNDNFEYLKSQEENAYTKLNKLFVKLDTADEMNNLTPVDLINIYSIIANDFINTSKISLNLNKQEVSFLILWRNCVNIRLYKNYLEFYKKTFKNNDLKDYLDERKVTFYHSITPANMYLVQDFKNSFYEMFYKNSFIGSIDISNTDFIKFKENIYDVKLNNIASNFDDINTNKNHNILTITNTYNYKYEILPEKDYNNKYLYKQVIYKSDIKKLLFKYDNYYDSSCSIILTFNNKSYTNPNIIFSLNEYNEKNIYLGFDLDTEPVINTEFIITSSITINIPLVLFNNDTTEYNKINIKKYDLLTKSLDNNIKINNIINNNILIDNLVYTSNKLKILTIEYFNNINIKPNKLKLISQNENLTNNVDFGYHSYIMTFNTLNGESLVSETLQVNVLTNKTITLSLSISLNKDIIDKKIYRTKANSNKFYLLKTIPNSETIFIDDISDDNLGIENQTEFLKRTNELNNNSNIIEKKLVKIIKYNNTYILTDYNNSQIILPKIFDNISNIYLEVLDTNYSLLQENIDFTIVNNKYNLSIDNNYFYYLINPDNLRENSKLIRDDSVLINTKRLNQQLMFKPPDFINENQDFNYFNNNYNYLSLDSSTNVYYVYSYFNNKTNEESLCSNILTLTQGYSNLTIEMPDTSNNPYITEKFIYKKKDNENQYKLVAVLPGSSSSLDDFYGFDNYKIRNPIFNYTNIYYKLHKPETPIVNAIDVYDYDQVYNLYFSAYTYAISYYNANTNEESLPSEYVTVDVYYGYTKILLPIVNTSNITHFKIYRSQYNTFHLFLVDTISSANNLYIDNKSDQDLDSITPKPSIYPFKYNILKIEKSNITPNLNDFISHSTDYNYTNEKNISDLNDYVFNKPLLMLVNTSETTNFTQDITLINSLNTSYLYFYNIHFKINETSIITLNDKNINYLLPLSNQQFFIKASTDKYYTLNSTIYNEETDNNNIYQYFNTCFDEFNINSYDLNLEYSDKILNDMIIKLDDVINTNTDYVKILDLLEIVNTKYTNIFSNIFNINSDLYGRTSQKILNNIKDILTFDNHDYSDNSHSALRLQSNLDNLNSDISNIIIKSSTIKILSPIFRYFNANNKISSDKISYLNNISDMFSNHINYINNNIDYLNLTENNNYKEEYLSLQEIIQNVRNKFFDYASNTKNAIITPLQPILEDNIYQIKINDTLLEKTDFYIDNNNILTSYNETILENKYYDTTLSVVNQNMFQNNKFNYIGISCVKSNFSNGGVYDNEINFDNYYNNYNLVDKYIKLDDNNIYKIILDINTNKLKINANIKNSLIIKPLKYYVYNNFYTSISENLTKLPSEKYLYIININTIPNISETIFYINNNLINGYYENNKLYLESDIILNFDSKYLIYLLSTYDYSSWTVTEITLFEIVNFKKVNSYTNEFEFYENDLYTFKTNDDFSTENVYFDTSSIIKFRNKHYYYLNFTGPDYFIKLYNNYENYDIEILPPIIIKDNYLNYYYSDYKYTKIIKEYPDTTFLLLINNDYKQFLIKSKDINLIPENNYHTLIFPKDFINGIQNFNFTYNIWDYINSNELFLSNLNLKPMVEKSYYAIITLDDNNYFNVVYIYFYYDTASTTNNIKFYTSSYNKYNVSLILHGIYLVDNNFISSDAKQYINLYKTYSSTEDYVNKKLTLTNNLLNDIEEPSQLTIKSSYNNKHFDVESIYNNVLILSDNNETEINMILNVNFNKYIIPLIFVNSQDNINNVKINYNVSEYSFSNSYVIISTSNINSGFTTIGYIDIEQNNLNNTYYSLSSDVELESTNNVYNVKVKFSIDNTIPIQTLKYKIKGVNQDKEYIIYFFVIITNNNNYISDLINLPYIAQPYYYSNAIPNFFDYFSLETATPNIIYSENSNLRLKNEVKNYDLYYKYYTDTRSIDTTYKIQMKNLNFHSVYNFKPALEYLNSKNFNSNINAVYYIIIYDNNKKVIFDNNFNFDNMKNTSIYYSISSPYFIKNDIVIYYKNKNIYEIVKYNYIFLETGEIISINNNYFYILGLNVNNNYDIELIEENNDIIYMSNGYYTLGNYFKKDNKSFPPMKYQCLTEFKSSYSLSIGESYIYNKKFYISNENINLTNIFVFDEKSLNFKLFVNNNKLYIVDNFVNLRKNTIICYNTNLYMINTIKDSLLVLNNEFISNDNNILLDFILPYQPFDSLIDELNFSGYAYRDYNTTLHLYIDYEDPYSYITYNISSGLELNTITNSNYTTNNLILSMMRTSFYCNFENPMNLNYNPITVTFNNKHPINLVFEKIENNIKLITHESILAKFKFFYLQPVKVGGKYNYLRNISKNINEEYIFEFLNSINIQNKFIITFSPSYNNEYEYLLYDKFKYNFALQIEDYNTLSNNVNVIRYVLYKNELIFIQEYIQDSKDKLLFDLSKSIQDNQITNQIITNSEYTNIYFHNNLWLQEINSKIVINNIDTLHNSYHLLLEQFENYNIIHLAKIIYPNKIKVYTDISINNVFYLDKLISIKLNLDGTFTYNSLSITQSRKMIPPHDKTIEIIKKYEIKYIGTPEIIDNLYKFYFIFISKNEKNIIDTIITAYENIIYINNIQYLIYFDVTKKLFYISSEKYISSDNIIIYTKTINYIDSVELINKTKKNIITNDDNLSYIIDTQYNDKELYLHKMKISRLKIDGINKYKYKLLDNNNNISLSINENYRINVNTQNVTNINTTENTFTTNDAIINDELVTTNNDININLYISKTITTDNISLNRLFSNVKQLKIKLYDNIKLNINSLYYNVKPWKSWAILNSINKISSLSTIIKPVYLKWSNNQVIKSYDNSITYSYLLNDEIKLLTLFLNDICSNPDKFNTLTQIRNIETLIFNYLKEFVIHPSFFLNVKDNINEFIKFNNINCIFDGEKLVFPNNNLIYISNEFTFDNTLKVVYRSVTNYNNINSEISKWFGRTDFTTLGVDINKLLKFINLIGEESKKFYNNMTEPFIDVPEYIYNNPLKFLINKIWENNKIDKINSDFTNELKLIYDLSETNNIYSGLLYSDKFSIIKYGVESESYYYEWNYDNEANISNVSIYNPNILLPVNIKPKLLTLPLFPYNINFTSSEIISNNSSYEIDFMNGSRLSENVNILKPTLFSDQLQFYSDYEMKPNDSIIVKENNKYTINSIIQLGVIYNINFNINHNYIDELFYRGNNLRIDNINNNSIDIVIPINEYINSNDIFEIRNNTSIKNINFSNDKYYITFFNTNFIYIENKTFIYSNKNYYLLNKDTEYYILKKDIEYNLTNIIIITNILPITLTTTNYILYDIILDNELLSTNYTPINFDFKLDTLVPLKVKILTNKKLLFYMNFEDIVTNISYYITKPELTIDYNNVSIFIYDKIDINLQTDGAYIYEPRDKNKETTDFFIINNKIYFTNKSNIIVNSNYSYIIKKIINIKNFSIEDYYLFIPLSEVPYGQNYDSNYYLINNKKQLYIDTNNSRVVFLLYQVFSNYNNNVSDITLTYYYISPEPQLPVNNFKQNQGFNKIVNFTRRIGQTMNNFVNSITNTNLFLHQINFIIPYTNNTIFYFYQNNFNNIFEYNKNTTNIRYENDITYLLCNEELYNYKFIQKNSWIITNFTINNTQLIIKLPSDFIMNIDDNYYYKINNDLLDKTTFIYQNGYLILNYQNNLSNINSFNFIQYYVNKEVGTIIKPKYNKQIEINYTYNFQYDVNNEFYLMAYSNNGEEHYENIYKLIVNDFITAINSKIYLITYQKEYIGKVFSQQGNNLYVSLPEINTSLSYTINLEGDQTFPVLLISFYTTSLIKTVFYKQLTQNKISVFINNPNNDFMYNNITGTASFYLVSREPYEITNLFRDNKFIQNENMKKNKILETISNQTIEKPKLLSPFKIFEYIRLYLDDQLLEELNENIYNIHYNLYLSNNQKEQFDKMIKYRFNKNKWELYLPLIFWFNNNAGLSLPLIALPYANLRLEYKLNNANILIENYVSNIQPNMKITLLNDVLLLDSVERKLFGTYSHEYIIERYITENENYINSLSSVIVKRFKGLIKEFHFITKIVNNNKYCYENITNIYDKYYNRYITALKYYEEFIKNNIYTSPEQKDYSIDINIIKNINVEYDNYNSNIISTRIQRLLDNFFKDLLKLLMFIEDKYLYNLSNSRKTYVLHIYVKYQFSNKQNIEEISPIENLTIKANGTELFAPRDSSYFNSVIPVQKYKNTLPIGFYTYAFSLFPLEPQFSGHLNFTNFDDIVLKFNSDSNVLDNPYKLYTIYKEYNVLRIMSGMGSLGW